MGQTSYSLSLNPWNVGTVGFPNDFTAFSYANPNDVMYPGLAVVQGSLDQSCDLPSAGNTKFIGVVVKDRNQAATALPTGPDSNTQISTFYPVNSMLAVMSRGQVQVQCYGAITPSSTVYVIDDVVEQASTLVFSADLIASNVVNGSVTVTKTSMVNGVQTPVAVTTAISPITYAVSNASTLTDIATALAAIANVEAAVSDGTHTITVTAEEDCVITFSGWLVTLGASQATVAITQTVAAVFSWQAGWFAGGSVAGASFQVVSGARWVSSSGTDPVGNLVAMLDINIPGVAT